MNRQRVKSIQNGSRTLLNMSACGKTKKWAKGLKLSRRGGGCGEKASRKVKEGEEGKMVVSLEAQGIERKSNSDRETRKREKKVLGWWGCRRGEGDKVKEKRREQKRSFGVLQGQANVGLTKPCTITMPGAKGRMGVFWRHVSRGFCWDH